MSLVARLVDAYADQLRAPWQDALPGAERVWLLLYPPPQERCVRTRLPHLRDVTESAGYRWLEVDLTDAFGRWLAHHEHAHAVVADPAALTRALLDEFGADVSARVRRALDGADDRTVVALVGAGALFPFARVGHLVGSVGHAVRGRLLILFPGRRDPVTHRCRLLDAADDVDHRALVLTPKERPAAERHDGLRPSPGGRRAAEAVR